VRNLYRKNLLAWEQWSRFAVGAGVMGLALFLGMSPWIEAAVIVAAVGLIATAVVGYCPACAAAGRKPIERGR
jgi:hypothetical protein